MITTNVDDKGKPDIQRVNPSYSIPSLFHPDLFTCTFDEQISFKCSTFSPYYYCVGRGCVSDYNAIFPFLRILVSIFFACCACNGKFRARQAALFMDVYMTTAGCLAATENEQEINHTDYRYITLCSMCFVSVLFLRPVCGCTRRLQPGLRLEFSRVRCATQGSANGAAGPPRCPQGKVRQRRRTRGRGGRGKKGKNKKMKRNEKYKNEDREEGEKNKQKTERKEKKKKTIRRRGRRRRTRRNRTTRTRRK